MAKLNADNHLKASLTRLLPSAATQLKGPVQPQEDTMLKMSIPIAAAAPAMRGPLVAMNFFALSRLRSQLLVRMFVLLVWVGGRDVIGVEAVLLVCTLGGASSLRSIAVDCVSKGLLVEIGSWRCIPFCTVLESSRFRSLEGR